MSKDGDSEKFREVENHSFKLFTLEFPTDTVFFFDTENAYITLMIAQ